MAHKFNIGDTVRLKSDSTEMQVMTVRAYADSNIAYQQQAIAENIQPETGVICDWNSKNGTPYFKMFHEDELKLV